MKQDFDNAEKLLELAKTTDILKLSSWDGKLQIDFQYFKELKGWPARGFKLRMTGDKKWARVRVYPEHEIINYLSQFELKEN
jgi:hypothetical protein